MTTLLFATTNIDKFRKTQVSLQPFGIDVEQVVLDIPEIQTAEGETIAREKALTAYNLLKKPVLVNDDSWEIPALHGFPGPNMKQCNHYLTAEDWLRLMHGMVDRSVSIVSYYAYCDGQDPLVFSSREDLVFLHESRGRHEKSPVVMVVARPGETRSIAEFISNGIEARDDQRDFWRQMSLSILAG